MGAVYENTSYTVYVNDKPVLSREEDNMKTGVAVVPGDFGKH